MPSIANRAAEMTLRHSKEDERFMRRALHLARRGYGQTSPNPMVGAVLVRNGKIIGNGWHQRAGGPHAEVEALRDAARRGASVRAATLYVTLEPCCTEGRTPPCTKAILAAGIARVVVAATDPNPKHAGRGFRVLRAARIRVEHGLLADASTRLNETFNHWIVSRTPFVTVKAAMTLDGRIATASGESKWITGKRAREKGMKLRQGADAILVGINTVLADDPGLTFRGPARQSGDRTVLPLRRIILDSQARTPLSSRVVSDEFSNLTTIVVTSTAPTRRVAALAKRVNVWVAPVKHAASRSAGFLSDPSRVDLGWLLKKLGRENVTSLLVEGGGEVNAAFLLGGRAHRVAFFYASKIIGGREARRAVGGAGARSLATALSLSDVEWRHVGDDIMMTARVTSDLPPSRRRRQP